MKKLMLMSFISIVASGVFASEPEGIPLPTLTKLARNFLETTFQTYLRRSDLVVSDITCSVDYSGTEKDRKDKNLLYYRIEGNFKNFPADGLLYAGRVKTTVAIRKTMIGSFELKDKDQNPESRIELLVDDLLSMEIRDTMIKTYLNRIDRPLLTSITHSEDESYPSEVHSYVSCELDKKTIKYFRFKFKAEKIKTTQYKKFELIHTQWKIGAADELFKCTYPAQKQIKQDACNDLFTVFNTLYKDANGNRQTFPSQSGINKIGFSEYALDKLTNRTAQFIIKFQYDLGVWFTWRRYTATATVLYEYDNQNNRWNYISIDVTDRKAL